MVKKRWQNLIHRKCPKCDNKLEWQGDVFRCVNSIDECQEGFAIGKGKLVSILTDETHIIRRFASPHELELIENAISDVMSGMI